MDYYEYKTLEGDTFDSIALDFYNDEFKASLLIEYNIRYCDTLIFGEGVTLKIPIIKVEDTSNLPIWRR